MKPTDMKPTTKFWIFLTGLCVIIFAIIFASFALSWHFLSSEEAHTIDRLVQKLLPFPILGSFILVFVIGGLIGMLFHFYIIPILRLAEKTRLIISVNPDYRIEESGAQEVVYLTRMINESADAFQKLRTEVDQTIAQAQAEIENERHRLAALMSELPHGVLVCNNDGQLLLYNKNVQDLLLGPNRNDQAASRKLIGIGRSVFGLIEREPILHALEMLQHAVDKGQHTPVSTFMVSLANGGCLRIKMAPVTQSEKDVKKISGFVLTLTDMTQQIEQESRRDAWLQNLIQNTQTSMGEIRDAITTILGTDLEPAALNEQRRRIDSASLGIADMLEESQQEYARMFHSTGGRESVSGRSLLEVLAKQLIDQCQIPVESDIDQELLLELDSHALGLGFNHLLKMVQTTAQPEKVHLSLKAIDEKQARLDLWLSRADLPENLVREWSTAPLFSDERNQTIDLQELLARWHGSMALVEKDGTNCLQLSLPGQSAESHMEVTQELEHRPVYYDFGLFNQTEWGEMAQASLSKLTFVVFDTETTGLQPSKGDEMIQIGAIRMVNGKILYDETMDQLIDPQRSVPPESVAIHGIAPEMVRGQPTIDQVLPQFHQFAEGAVLVAHNAAFDMKFLRMKEELCGLAFDHPVLDTLLLSSIVHPNPESHNLEEIAQRLNVTIVGRHTALGDAIVTAEVLAKLIPLLQAQGIDSLDEAMSASAWSKYAKIKF